MKIYKRFFGVATCFFLLLLAPVKNDSFAACPASPAGDLVKIAGYAFTAPTIQEAYDYASDPVPTGLGLSDFTLQLVGGVFSGDVVIDGGAVEFDGGYDCSFATQVSSSSILGTITITSTGALVATVNTESPKVVSSPQCAFDNDDDGFTSIGSCSGSADDCDDTNPDVYPGAVELCDGLDNDCNGQIDDGTSPVDVDNDGYSAEGSCGTSDDCNDSNAGINPGAEEIPFDGIDQDCSGSDLTFAGESCVDCHAPASNWTNLHDLTTPPDGTCASCHATHVNNILSGHYGDTVRTASPSNNMTAGQPIVCVSCHDPDAANHSGGIALGTGANIVGGKIAADFPNITCDTCHNGITPHDTAAVHNNRLIDSTCANCHTSDNSVLGSPGTGTLTSAADVDTLHGVVTATDCAICHAYSGTLLNKAVVLGTIQLGLDGTQVSCLNCHTDKGVGHGNFEHPIEVGPNDLSYDPPGQLCSDCHVVANWAEIEGTEHNVDTNGVGSCATCHNSPRQAVIDTIALAADPTHCLDCHADKNLTVHGSVDHVAATYVTGGATYCLDCHDPGGAVNGTVDVTHGGDCTLCHTTIPALQPGVPAGGGDCVTCHTVTWQVLHMTNPPDHSSLVTTLGTNNCASCHADALVDASTHLSDCTNCHNASDGTLVTLYDTNLQTFAVGGNCETCHTDGWETTHFANNNTTTTHNSLVQVAATSCGDCHIDPPPLTDNADLQVHDACGSCHNSDGSRVVLYDTNLQTFVLGGDCTTCHTDIFDTIHVNHTHTVAQGPGDLSFEVPGTPCSDCHVVSTWLEIEGTEHNVATNGAGSCATCHNSPRQEVIDAIALGANPTNCLDCHSSKNLTVHGSIDHVASGDVTLATACVDCHDDSVQGANWTVDVTHSANCTLCHTTVPDLQPGVSAGPADCSTCHSADWNVTHTAVTPDHSSLVTTLGTDNCSSCHADTLIDASTHLSDCSNCHNGDGSLVTINNTNLQTFAAGGNCETCHNTGWEAMHFDNNNGTTTHNALVQVAATSCGSCHSDPPPLTDNADFKVHVSCGNCHNANGSLHLPLVGFNFTTGGDCTTCHGNDWGGLHPAPDHSSLVTTLGTDNCASCHADALIDASTHLSDCSNCHNGDGSLVTTYNTNLQTFLAGGNCETCHTLGWESTHFANNNGFTTHNSLVTVAGTTAGWTNCGSCHSDPPPLTDNADAKVHNLCATCHNANGSLVTTNGTNNQDFTAGGNCEACHTNSWNAMHNGHSHTVELGTGDLSSGTSCGDCHVVANWSQINGTEHNVATNGPSSCETCHNSPRQEVIDAIALGANPTNCLDCHTDKTVAHGSIDHVAATYVTVGGTGLYYDSVVEYEDCATAGNCKTCADCHDPGGAANATVDVTHGGDCALCHTTVPNLQPGVPAGGGDCVTCHTPSQHTLWTRYMDTCSRQNGGEHGQPGIACHPGFNNGPGNSFHDAHNPAGGWADRNSATSGLTYPFASNPEMWIPNWPLNPTCNTCHTAPDDDSSGAGCGACHNFPSKGDLHDIHAGKKAGEQDIDCANCHWNS